MIEEQLLTPREVARYLRVDPATVRRWIDDGLLEAVELPHKGKRRSHRIPKSTLPTLKRSPQLLAYE